MEKALHALSPLERAAQYREFAAAALTRAMIAESAWVRASQLDMAARWDGLAQDVERRLELLD